LFSIYEKGLRSTASGLPPPCYGGRDDVRPLAISPVSERASTEMEYKKRLRKKHVKDRKVVCEKLASTDTKMDSGTAQYKYAYVEGTVN